MPSADGLYVLAVAADATKGDVQVDLVAGIAGYVALALLWMTVVWGIIQRVGWSFTKVKYASLQAVHRAFAILGLTLALVHSLTQIARVNGSIKYYDLFLPFINETDPFGTGLGILGLEIAVAVTISVGFQRALGYNRWRVLHLLSYGSFTMVSAHAVISGTNGTVQLFSGVWAVNGVILGGWGLTVVLGLVTALRPQRPANTGLDPAEPEIDPDAAVPIQVDPIKCARFAFCEHEAPDLFKLRADGMLTHQPKVGPERLDAAIEAARICPARAITLGKGGKFGAAPPPGLRTTGSMQLALTAGRGTGSQPALRTGSQPAMRTGAQPAQQVHQAQPMQPPMQPMQPPMQPVPMQQPPMQPQRALPALPAGSSHQPRPTGSQPAVGHPPVGQPYPGQPMYATGAQPPVDANGQPVLRLVPTSPAVGQPQAPVPAGAHAGLQPGMYQGVQGPVRPLRQPEQAPLRPATPPPPLPSGYEPVTAMPSSFSQGFQAIADYRPTAMPIREDPPPMPRREDPPSAPRHAERPRGTTYDTGSRDYGGRHHRDD